MNNLKLLPICALLLLNIYSVSSAQPIFIGVNCGSQQPFMSPWGNLFQPDQPYSTANGFGYVGGFSPPSGPFESIGGTEGLTPIYLDRREGDFSYLFDLPPGLYAVTLYLAEMNFHWRDFRIFSIGIEGSLIVPGLDIFDVVGRAYGLPLRFLVECDDGQLNVDFIPDIEGGTLSGISVRAVQPDGVPPLPPIGFETIGGYDMNILFWWPNPAPDFVGYRIYRRESGQAWQPLTPEPHPLSRFLDYDVIPYTEYEYKVTAEDFWGNESDVSDSLNAVPIPNQTTQLPVYEMFITEENLYQLNIDIWSDEYVDADLVIESEQFFNSGVRYRGNITRHLSKKNYKLNLPNGELFNGRDKFNLQAEMMDFSMLKDRLCYQTFDLMNCLNPLSQNIHLQRNGEFIGVYLDLEQVDNHFLERNGLSTGGNLYKCESDLSILPAYEIYQLLYTKENNPNSDWDDIIEFIEWVNFSSPEEFHYEAGSRFALDEYLDIYTVLIATADCDFPFHNYYMYSNPVDGKWYFVAWDHNSSFNYPLSPIDLGTEESPSPIGNSWNKLLDKVLEDSLFCYAYCKKMERFLDDGFSPPSFQGMITAAHQEIEYDAVRDMYKKGWEEPFLFLEGADSLCSFVEIRVPFLQGEIPGFIINPNLGYCFQFNEIQADNQTTIPDEAGDFDPWLEIYNLAPVELDLQGFILHYGGESWTLPPEAVVDDNGFLIIWLDGEPDEGPLHSSIILSPDGGELLLEEPPSGIVISVVYPSLEADQVYARLEDGIGDWVDYIPPTPGSTNTPLENPSALVINEFLAINNTINTDPAGEYDDWMEIFNPTTDTIQIRGLYLTDELARPTKWAFPDTAILPESFILIWCDDDPEQGPLHATFKLSGGGEQAGLFDRDGVTSIDTITFSAQQEDISFGRYPDGENAWYFMTPTPENTNSPPLAVPYSGSGKSIPKEFGLEPNFPNPFNSTTIIRIAIPRQSFVRLSVYDILGRKTITLKNGLLQPGYHSFIFSGKNLASGIYFCRLEAGDFTAVEKILLIK
ncbi:MAG: CotH kinase family protein [candidate division Zixibacteria bacterium]|nr:CotH kinase family protein [Candidatus Tariuqbacter arcticus]